MPSNIYREIQTSELCMPYLLEPVNIKTDKQTIQTRQTRQTKHTRQTSYT